MVVGCGLGPDSGVDIDEPGSDDDIGTGAAGAGMGTTGVRELDGGDDLGTVVGLYVVAGGSDGLGLDECLEVDEGGVNSAGLLVDGGLSVLGETMELFLADVFIFSRLLTRGSGVITEECLFGCVK